MCCTHVKLNFSICCFFSTLETRHEMAGVLHGMEKYEEALRIYEEVTEKRRKVLGDNDSDTLESQHEMALVLSEFGKPEDALQLFEKVYQLRKDTAGINDEETLETV